MLKPLSKGIFISFEGVEGSGKSTQARLLAESLAAEGYPVCLTREPGGTALGDSIRDLLLDSVHTAMCGVTELFLYSAARAQHVQEKIIPELERGAVVITDRFADSTIAYQGYGRGLDLETLYTVDGITTGGLTPHVTVLLDIDVAAGLQRNREARKSDRFEMEDISFHQRVREGFLEIAARNPGRFLVVDGSLSVAEAGRMIRQGVRFVEREHGRAGRDRTCT